jgi:hypothetical protein
VDAASDDVVCSRASFHGSATADAVTAARITGRENNAVANAAAVKRVGYFCSLLFGISCWRS